MTRTVLLTMVLLLLPMTGAATIYSFVDEAGVRHFSNVPVDPRYRPLTEQPVKLTLLSPSSYDREINTAARRYGLDPGLIRAVIKAESGFNRHAVSPKGAMGLMQLMPGTARDLRVAAPFDAGENILGGSRYLRRMLDRFQGDLELALAAYNAGPERIKPGEGVPAIAETRTYVRRVLREYYRLGRQNGAPGNGFLQEAAR